MIKPIIIVGAGRHGRGVADILENDDATNDVAGYLDDTQAVGDLVLGYPVLGQFSAIRDKAFVSDHSWFVAIGDNIIRGDLCRSLADRGAIFVNVIHPSAQISKRATLGRGLYIGACAVVPAGSVVGDWVIIGAHAYLGLDGQVGESAFLGHGTIMAGGTSVGARSFVGSGAVVSNGAGIGADCIVGACSLVIGKLSDGTKAYGVPAKPGGMRLHPFRR